MGFLCTHFYRWLEWTLIELRLIFVIFQFQSEILDLKRLDKISVDLNIPVPDPVIVNEDGTDGVSERIIRNRKFYCAVRLQVAKFKHPR